jgi:DHA2 family multidrug resistance protein-like MFS transporter
MKVAAMESNLPGAIFWQRRACLNHFARRLLRGAREAFTGSMHVVAAVSSGIMICIAILAMIKLRHIRPIGQKAPHGGTKVPIHD